MTKMSTTIALILAAVIFRGQSLPLELVTSTVPVTRNVTLSGHLNESQPNGSLIASVRIPTGDGGERTDGTFTDRNASNGNLAAGERWCLQEVRNATSGCRHREATEANNAGLSLGNARRRRRGGCSLRGASHQNDESALAVDKGRELAGEARGKLKKKKKLKKWAIPLLLAYKLKFFALVPLLVSGLVLLVGVTGAAGFFFALFAATISIRSHSKW